MAIIGVSGKIGSGKDTVGSVIQYLTSNKVHNQNLTYNEWLEFYPIKNGISGWKIVKFADKLKDIVCILLGCTREQLEDREFKNTELGEEWTRYGYADGFIKKYIGNGKMSVTIMNNKQCSKEEYEEHYKTNWQTAYKTKYTPRILLQYIGTDLFREKIHENVWVNATLSDYKHIPNNSFGNRQLDDINDIPYEYPNWIITDVRFSNEADAVKSRGGINIRVNRLNKELLDTDEKFNDEFNKHYHPSETALDNYIFDYVIDNNGTIEDLIIKVKEILIKEQII